MFTDALDALDFLFKLTDVCFLPLTESTLAGSTGDSLDPMKGQHAYLGSTILCGTLRG